MSMRYFDASVVTPTVFVLFTVLSIAGSLILYKEFVAMPPFHIALFVFGYVRMSVCLLLLCAYSEVVFYCVK